MNSWVYIIWVVIEVLLVITTGALWTVSPDTLALNLSLTVFICVLGILLVYPRRVDFLTWIKSRQFVMAFTQIIQFFLILGIVALINHLAWRYPFKLDLTEKGLNTLSGLTQRILSDLPKGVEVSFYARR